MAKYDVERLLNDIQTLLAANFNTKVAAINTDKNDSISLKTISSSAFFIQELNGADVNWNPFILIAEENIESELIPGGSVETIKVSITIVLKDEGEDLGNISSKRMLRYRRALKEVIEDSFQIATSANILKVQSLPIVMFRNEEGENYRSSGIEVFSCIG